jgi:hypothetical protein
MSSKSPAASPQPIKVRVHVGADHLVRLPPDIPEGPAELIVIPSVKASADARRLAFGRYDAVGFRVPADFDAPLPDEVSASFDGEPDEQL